MRAVRRPGRLPATALREIAPGSEWGVSPMRRILPAMAAVAATAVLAACGSSGGGSAGAAPSASASATAASCSNAAIQKDLYSPAC